MVKILKHKKAPSLLLWRLALQPAGCKEVFGSGSSLRDLVIVKSRGGCDISGFCVAKMCYECDITK